MGACPCPKAFEDATAWEALKRKENCFDFPGTIISGEVDSTVVIKGKAIIGEGTEIGPYVVIEGPVIIGRNCTIRPFSLIRPGTILGDNCVVGNGSEVKNAIVFNEAKIASQTFVGDSILGKGARIGSGTILANRRFDQADIYFKIHGEKVFSGSDKFGAVVGDFCRFGANIVALPGTIIGKHTWIGPNLSLGGFFEGNKYIRMKPQYEILDKERKELSSVDREGKI